MSTQSSIVLDMAEAASKTFFATFPDEIQQQAFDKVLYDARMALSVVLSLGSSGNASSFNEAVALWSDAWQKVLALGNELGMLTQESNKVVLRSATVNYTPVFIPGLNSFPVAE
jgi:hypothetical protein